MDDAHKHLFDIMTGYWPAQAVYVAAKLGIADLLVEGPKTPDAIARATGSQSELIYRLLRALASVGVFFEDDAGRFALTPMASLLVENAAGSFRSMAMMYGEECFQAWGHLLDGIQSGATPFERRFGEDFFAYVRHRPETSRTFNHAMKEKSELHIRAVMDIYDFSSADTIVDVGGGYGHFLCAILTQYPNAQGILYDKNHVVNDARQYLRDAGVLNRCRVQAGDFFDSVPLGGEVYLLKAILHDWNDDTALTILRNCRGAIPANGKILIVELVVPSGNAADYGKWLDLHMLVMLQGKERTATEYQTLLAKAGYKLKRLLPTTADVSILEAAPA